MKRPEFIVRERTADAPMRTEAEASSLTITGARVLTDTGFVDACVHLHGGVIAGLSASAGDAKTLIRADGLLALPGIVDLHGDAFERQWMPRPQVRFPLELALADTDRQLAANGIKIGRAHV